MAESVFIEGGTPLSGTVSVSGAKNSALPVLMASVLATSPCTLANVPELEDIAVTKRILNSLGCSVKVRDGVTTINPIDTKELSLPQTLFKSLRAGFWLLGPLLTRYKEVRMPLPGGDAIGKRPIDIHLQGLASLGCDVKVIDGFVVASAHEGLKPAHIKMDFPSVGATNHLLMTAAGTEGISVLEGVAREPECQQLAEVLTEMGARVSGIGTSKLTVVGRKELSGHTTEIIGDRIEAATWLAAGFITGGKVTVENCALAPLSRILEVFQSMGANLSCSSGCVTLSAEGSIKPQVITTGPYPALATDVQPILMALLCVAEGRSIISERVFQNRFRHIEEYMHFGSNISISDSVANILGVNELIPSLADACDIRAAAGLVLLALAANGESEIREPYHLHRGYENFIQKLNSLGAKVRIGNSFEAREVVFGC